ncbi:hypothetical protein F5J12DRAFT_458895 [Pisolithus orientalis]|uniref:Uncharacterized protein n=1 Tax=Pisolithus tinctorius Marx 270 TaxID=870435 RepID=A0A0C3PHN3_PISTI|nr:uncharacterized protein F5J12DRAFT_458895 [Pisolithus orientalis]KAI5992280.1 hypothetical protein F5J12DRAFT_458895 [Pisolithus orientalis]KAI6149938.1 hypothetical protein BKA82DRAFT_136070 [Pisolithus tinctorius]KIO07534.1 hypothetical protein M404DRAFT_136070 [Pisolithus tinctorius Marx 270]
MDDTTRPPVRLQAISSKPLSLKDTQRHLDEFLSDLKRRNAFAKGLDSTIISQLEKLNNALGEERARERNDR